MTRVKPSSLSVFLSLVLCEEGGMEAAEVQRDHQALTAGRRFGSSTIPGTGMSCHILKPREPCASINIGSLKTF